MATSFNDQHAHKMSQRSESDFFEGGSGDENISNQSQEKKYKSCVLMNNDEEDKNLLNIS